MLIKVLYRSIFLHEKLSLNQLLKKFPNCVEPEDPFPCSHRPILIKMNSDLIKKLFFGDDLDYRPCDGTRR
jgi:hypothetical protein